MGNTSTWEKVTNVITIFIASVSLFVACQATKQTKIQSDLAQRSIEQTRIQIGQSKKATIAEYRPYMRVRALPFHLVSGTEIGDYIKFSFGLPLRFKNLGKTPAKLEYLNFVVNQDDYTAFNFREKVYFSESNNISTEVLRTNDTTIEYKQSLNNRINYDPENKSMLTEMLFPNDSTEMKWNSDFHFNPRINFVFIHILLVYLDEFGNYHDYYIVEKSAIENTTLVKRHPFVSSRTYEKNPVPFSRIR